MIDFPIKFPVKGSERAHPGDLSLHCTIPRCLCEKVIKFAFCHKIGILIIVKQPGYVPDHSLANANSSINLANNLIIFQTKESIWVLKGENNGH